MHSCSRFQPGFIFKLSAIYVKTIEIFFLKKKPAIVSNFIAILKNLKTFLLENIHVLNQNLEVPGTSPNSITE